jgi:hypothetical protein
MLFPKAILIAQRDLDAPLRHALEIKRSRKKEKKPQRWRQSPYTRSATAVGALAIPSPRALF